MVAQFICIDLDERLQKRRIFTTTDSAAAAAVKDDECNSSAEEVAGTCKRKRD